MAPYICSVLEEALLKSNGLFYEPFMGGFNIIPRMSDASYMRAYCSDLDESIVTLYQAVIFGWEPPVELSRELWEQLRQADDPLNPMTAFAAYGCSFAGKRWGGYAKDNLKNRKYYAQAASRRLIKIFKDVSNVKIDHGDYRSLNIHSGSVVYCDPPYRGVTGYQFAFDHEEFWKWCQELIDDDCLVFVSEYECPVGWVEILNKENPSVTRIGKHRPALEKLFTGAI